MHSTLLALAKTDDVIGLKGALSNQGDLAFSDSVGDYALLREAAGFGSNQVVSFLLSLGHPVGVSDVHGPEAPLRNAIAFGHLSTVRLLIESNANLRAEDNLGPNMPLRVAIFNRQHAIAKWLLDREIAPTHANGECVELREAIQTNDREMIALISDWVTASRS